MTRRTILLIAVTLVTGLVGRAQSRPVLHQIHKIHVAAMGSGAESDRFHGLLQGELRKAGFEISDSTSAAEADLGGEFSSEVHGDFSSAHANLRLKSRDGKRTLWSADYISQHRGSTAEDVVKTLAQTCAERFHHDWEKD
jgi:hypothetical protein